MNKKDVILKSYVSWVKKNGMHPRRTDLAKMGVTREAVRYHYGNYILLRAEAKKLYPEAFKNIIDESFFTVERTKRLHQAIKTHKRFVITTAVTGCDVHAGFLASIKTYCKKNNAALLVLTAVDNASVKSRGSFIDPILQNEHIVTTDVSLNRKIAIRGIKINAKATDPVTGLSRIGQREGSFIYASPKQRLKMTATSNVKLPHALMSTGALTKPDYQVERHLSARTAYIADHDHVIGAVIVEIESDDEYHFRQVQADSQGFFADLGKLYKPGKVERYDADSLVLGDWHSSETDRSARLAFVEGENSVASVVKPRRIVIHDGFSGISINHHEQHNHILKAQRAMRGELDLERELRIYGQDLQSLATKANELVIVKSNHDLFLDRYLAEGTYVTDPQNHRISLYLALAMLDGANPIKAAMDLFGLEFSAKMTWLELDEDFKVAGIELGAHGHKGNNGAPGSLASLEQAYGSCVVGHSHTPQILRQAWQVGTLSRLKLEYNQGPSSWMHTSCIVYKNGTRQFINSINGKWRASRG